MKTTLVIGIDPGTHTGIGVWDMTDRRLIEVFGRDMEDAQLYIQDMRTRHEVFLVLEDARMMKTGRRPGGEARAQGAGAVKAVSTMWESWAQKHGIPMYRRAPGVATKKSRGITKWNDDEFRAYTGWQQRTNNHGRDAAMMVFATTETHLAWMRKMAEAQLKPKVKPRRVAQKQAAQ